MGPPATTLLPSPARSVGGGGTDGAGVPRNVQIPPPPPAYDELSTSQSQAVSQAITAQAKLWPRFTDHTYRDFSNYIEDGGKLDKHKKCERNFPARLHAMLSDEQYSHIISWMPHGRAWKVQNKKLLIEEAIPKYFGQSKYASFNRQLSGWGFKRLHKLGMGKIINPVCACVACIIHSSSTSTISLSLSSFICCHTYTDTGAYYHELFLQGHPRLTILMRRRNSPGHGRAIPYMEGEPDFYLISKTAPLFTAAAEADKKPAAYSPKFDGKEEEVVDTNAKTESSTQEILGLYPRQFDSLVTVTAAASSRCGTSVNVNAKQCQATRTGDLHQHDVGGKAPHKDEIGLFTQPETESRHHHGHGATQLLSHDDLGNGNLHDQSKNAQSRCQVLTQPGAKLDLHDSASTANPPTPTHTPTPNVTTENHQKSPTTTWGSSDNLQDPIGFDCFNNDNEVGDSLGKYEWSKLVSSPSQTINDNDEKSASGDGGKANHLWPWGQRQQAGSGASITPFELGGKPWCHSPIQPQLSDCLSQWGNPFEFEQQQHQHCQPRQGNNYAGGPYLFTCEGNIALTTNERSSPPRTVGQIMKMPIVTYGYGTRHAQSSSTMPSTSSYRSNPPTLSRQNLVTVAVPPGKLGILLSNNDYAGGVSSTPTRISDIQSESSVMAGKVRVGDRLMAIDGEDVSRLDSKQSTSILTSKCEFRRILVFEYWQSSNNNNDMQEWI